MNDLLQLVPMFAFMLIPVWIPLAAAAFGLVSDAIKAPAKVVAHPGAAARAAGRHAAHAAQAAHVTPVGPRVLAEGTAR